MNTITAAYTENLTDPGEAIRVKNRSTSVVRALMVLAVALATASCAWWEDAGDPTPPHNIDLESLGDNVLRPVPLYVEFIEYSDEELKARADAIGRGEDVPPLALDPARPPEVIAAERSAVDFVIFEGLQPGIYTFDAWMGGRPEGETGEVWLRAIDEERGTVLSERELLETARIDVVAPAIGYEHFAGADNNIKIYEGQWGDPYPVIFEMWYRPHNGDSTMLLAKTYLIEGWEF